MGKRNQVTADLKISTKVQLENSRNFINQLDKIIDGFDFGNKINNQLVNAKNQLKDYNKILEKVQNKSLISDNELKDLVKAGKEIGNIISKTEKLYVNLSSSELQKFSKEYINKVKAQEEAIAKIKNEYATKTGKNFDKELANYDKLSAKVKALEKEKSNLAKNGVEALVTKQIEQTNQKLEEQKNKLIEIRKLQQDSANAYSSTVDIESKKRGYGSYDDIKNVKIQSEDQIRKQLGNAEYKKQSNIISEINKEIKNIEKNKQDSNSLDKAAIELARKYKIENVSTLDSLKQQIKLKKDNLNTYKNNKSDLANEKLVTVELEKQNKILNDRNAIESAGKAAELTVIQQGGYTSKASLTASASATNRSITTLEGQLTESGIENITNTATQTIAGRLDKIAAEIENGNQDLSTIDETNKKLATQSERGIDEQDLNKNTQEIGKAVNDTADKKINPHTTEDNSRIAGSILNVLEPSISTGDFETLIKDNISDVDYNTADMSKVYSELFEVTNKGFKQLAVGEIDFEELNKIIKEKKDEVRQSLQEVFDNLRIELNDLSIQMPEAKTEKQREIIRNDIAEAESKMAKLDNVILSVNKDSDIIDKRLQNFNKNNNSYKIIGDSANDTANKISKAAEQSSFLSSTFDDFKNKVGYFLSLNYIFDQMTRKVTEAVQVTKEMDKDMTQIGLVLGKTSGQVWKNFNTYSQMAERLNTTTSEVTKSMKLFYQQGLNTAEVNKMVEASAIAAALGESTMAEASETLTSIINSYNLSANEAMMVTDKISQIAIVSAADFGELSTAIEKVASSAASAGLDLDHMMGYLAKMIETTREAPTNIGTALKTIVANFTQFKEDPSGLTEEGTEINKVDKALKSVGISLTNTNGEVRDLSEVLDELGGKWDNLTRNQKSYLATAIAGTRQQSRFYAMMNDYERTLELIAEGSNSAGKAQQQFALYSNSLEASSKRLNNEWEKFFNDITKGNGVIRIFTNILTDLMKVVNEMGPIGTSLGLVAFITQIRKSIANVDTFNKSIEKIYENKKLIDRLQNLSNQQKDIKRNGISHNGVDLKKNKESIREIYDKEGLGSLLKVKDLDKILKLIKTKKDIEKLKKEIEALPFSFEKLEKRGKKTFLSIKAKTISASMAIKAFSKAIAIATMEMAAMWAIGKIISAIGEIIDANTESAEKFAEKAEKANENAETIKGLRDEYKELSEKVNRTAEEESRLVEITNEVTKVSTELGNALSTNVSAFKDNVDIMDAYIAKQKEIAGQNSILSAVRAGKENNNWWNQVKRFFGGNDKDTEDATTAKTLYSEIDTGAIKKYNLDSQRQSILSNYATQLMNKLDSINKNANDWYSSLDDYKNKISAMAESLSNLDSTALKIYSNLQVDFANQDLSYDELQKRVESSNINPEIKENYLNSIKTAKYNSVQAITDKTNINGQTASELVNKLSRKDLTKLFNPDNLDILNETEQKQYWNAISNLFNDDKIKKEIIKVISEKGVEGLSDFIENLNNTEINYLDIVKEVTSGLVSLETTVENAKKAFEKLNTLLNDKAWNGRNLSQLDIISGLLDGTYNIQDINTIGNSNMLTLSLTTMLNNLEAQYARLEKPFDEQVKNLETQIQYYSNYGDSLVADAEEKLKLQQEELNKAQENYTKEVANKKTNDEYRQQMEVDARTEYDDWANNGAWWNMLPLVGQGIYFGGLAAENDYLKEVQKDNEASRISDETILQQKKLILDEQKTKYEEINAELQRAIELKDLMKMSDEEIANKAKDNVNTWIKQNKESEKWVSILNNAGKEVGKVNANAFVKNSFINDNKEEGMTLDEAKQIQKEYEDVAENNIKLYADEEKQLNNAKKAAIDYADAQVKTAKEIQSGYIKTLSAIEAIKNKSLQYQETYRAVFESFSSAGQVYNELEKVANAYSLCNKGAEGYFDVAQAIADDPSLIDALDMESEYLELDKEKVIELGKTKVQTQIDELKTKLEGTNAIIGLIQAQIEAGNAQTVAEASNLDDKSDIIASAIAYNKDYTNSNKESVDTENENLEISVDNWTNWQEAIIKIMQNVENQRAKLAQNIANGETPAGSTSTTTLTGISVNYSGKGAKTADEIKKTNKEEYDKLLDTIKTSDTSKLQSMLESYQKQKAVLEKSINSLNKYKKNMANNLADISGTKSSGGKDKFDEMIEKLEHFYNYLRQLENIEAKLNKIREKRNLIDADKNYYIDDLKEENKLLQEQQKIYNAYIADETDYLKTLRNELKSQFGKWVSFTDEGVVQVKQTEFKITSEKEQEKYQNFSELLQEYQNEYNTREENKNKLYEIENTQLENIKTMYDKILSRVTDITDELNRQQDLLDHDMTMQFGSIAQFDIMNEKMANAVKGIKTTMGYLNDFEGQIKGLNTEVKNGPFKELLIWDEALEIWRVNEEKLQSNSIIKKYEKLGYTFSDIEVYVHSIATKSQSIREAWKETEDSANSFAEALKSLIDDRIDLIQDYYSAATDELNKLFDSFDRKNNNIDNENNLFGTVTESLEDKYLTLTTATVVLKQTIQQLNDNKASILQRIQDEYPEYIKLVNGVAVINKQAIQEATDLTAEERAELLLLYGVFESANDQVIEMEDKLVDYFNKMLEMEEAKRDAIINLKQQVHDELMARDQQEIDDLQAKYDKMSQLDNEYYSKLSQKINDARQLRSQRQEGQSIAQTQAKLATLKADNSGAYNAQIIELQKQLNQQLQDQADNDIDRELERIQREQKQREEDRQLTISAMENVLTFKDENNWYWQEAQRIWNEGPESVTGFLRSSREYMNISDEQRALEFENLTNSMNTAFSILQTAAGESDRISDGVVSNKSDEQQEKLDNVNNNLSFIQSQITEEAKELFGKIDWTNAQSFEKLDKLDNTINGVPVTIKDNLDNLYRNEIKPGTEGIKEKIKEYLGANSDIWNKLGLVDTSINKVDFNIANGFTKTIDEISTAKTTIANGIKEATKQYYDWNKKFFTYIDEQYAKTHATKPSTSTSVSTGSKPTTGSSNKNSSSSSGSKGNSSSAKGPSLALGSAVKVKAGRTWYYTTNGAVPSGDTTGYANRTLYIVNSTNGKYPYAIGTRKGKVNSALGWVKKTDIVGYKTGGYVDYTGVANVHGSKTKPEAFLNAKQTQLFEALRDGLTRKVNTQNYSRDNKENSKEEYNIDNVNIEVKELADTDSVGKITKKIKEEIYKDATGRNNMAIRRR